jgi:radical SAM protein with 4Fe4S-binding SPASM domain
VDLGFEAYVERRMATAVRDRRPLSALFELTPTCNLRCHFCYVALDPYKGPYLSTAQVCAIIDKLEAAGLLTLQLTGGEIFSRRDFEQIYRHAHATGMMINLFTNATLVNERIAALLTELPPAFVEVSIYGADAEHYEGVTGIRGSFAKFERGVRLLQEAGVALYLKHPASTLTAEHVPAIRAWCEARHLPHKLSFTIENRHDGGDTPSLYRIQPKRVRELETFHRGPRDLPTAECSITPDDGIERLYRCGAGRVALFVDGLGNASHCVIDRSPSFSLIELSFEEVWERIGAWIDQPLPADAPCSGCSLRAGCDNCPARARLSTGSPYLKDDYYCDITHAAHGLPPGAAAAMKVAPRPLGACNAA